MERDLEYEENNIGYDEQYPKADGGGIKCKNYEICTSILPKWWFECKNNYLCDNCLIQFGHDLKINNTAECPVCLEEKRSISQPNCAHSLCVDCFRRCYYGDESTDNEPQFPYPEIEDEYYNDPEHPNKEKWEIKYPLIKTYNEDWNKWDNARNEKYEKEENLRVCPLCRK